MLSKERNVVKTGLGDCLENWIGIEICSKQKFQMSLAILIKFGVLQEHRDKGSPDANVTSLASKLVRFVTTDLLSRGSVRCLATSTSTKSSYEIVMSKTVRLVFSPTMSTTVKGE